MKRPPESASSVIAVIAVIAGVRAGICMIAVPTLILDVRASTQAAGVTASEPYASELQTESKPNASASSTRSTGNVMSAPEYPSTIPSFIAVSLCGVVHTA